MCLEQKQEKYEILQRKIADHYANTPVQYTAIFHGCKNDNFQMNFVLKKILFLLKTWIMGTCTR